MKLIWMVKSEKGYWEKGQPEYYRIILEDDELLGQFYSHNMKEWVTNSKGSSTLRWLFIDTDILIVEIEK